MRRIALVCLIALGVGAVGWGANPPMFEKALKELNKALDLIAELEPNREGELHNTARGATRIIHAPNPAAIFVYPLDGDEVDGSEPITMLVEIHNWSVIPERATNTATQFANGYHELGIGHTHTWVYDMDTGERVRFTGANGLTEVGDTGVFTSAPFTLPPGRYKAYVQLQNHDHTGPIQATPQSLPPFDAVAFTVVGPAE